MYCYISQTIQLNISHLLNGTVKWSNSSISNDSFLHKSTKLNGSMYYYGSLTIVICFHTVNCKTVLFLRIQFSISHLFAHSLISNSSIWPIGKTLSGAPTLGKSRPRSNGNERVLRIPQSSNDGASPSDFLLSYQDTHWVGGILISPQRRNRCILQPSNWLGSIVVRVPSMDQIDLFLNASNTIVTGNYFF